ncbi:tRNA lysidine(34) synthetase TilS [Neptunitalea lumnitzerae]|uniref:tRNA(Ile)-lysidine synthase n=1 Tax=Neptunitalea lumnitzerae TaxID=2965509 RepID=A0ABQ5MK88_9FLAO|nr:tRNA lysidine(34) synthetase TilS [Neptunitalea sp. Y10]GLB49794.1 tRNA(Ile)-lysidine synthase [Neptunitalea sp. Y10]
MLKEFTYHLNISFPQLLQKKVLLAVSGGVDSMVMLHLFQELKADLAVAHCNFSLRGTESDGDEQLVVDTTKKYKVPIYCKRFETKKYAADKGLNTQLAARELRYAWFNELCVTHGFEHILVAHHANDKIETFLINLSRGTGIDGLAGIPVENDKVVRPMLPFSRETIEAYAKSQGIDWREDSSNASDAYLRNKIRHHITPLLEELHPNFLENFLKTQEYLMGSKAIVDRHIAELKSVLFIKENGVIKIPVVQLSALNPLATYLFELFKPYGFTSWKDVEHLLSAQGGKVVYSKTHELSKHRDTLILRAIENVVSDTYIFNTIPEEIDQPVKLSFKIVEEIQEIGDSVIYVDGEKLNLPLIVRKRKIGDYFHPFGMFGKKKVSKFYKDEKYSIKAKEEQWILCTEQDIVWIIGKRADRRFSVSEQTKTILKIQVIT